MTTLGRIEFPKTYTHSTGRMHITYLIRRFKESGLVGNIDLVDDLDCTRNHGFHMRVDGTNCIVYVRDRPPLKMKYFIDESDEWVKNFYGNNIKFVFIYQYNIANKEEYDKIEEKTGIRVLPWTYSPSFPDYPLGAIEWQNKEHKWLANGAFNFDVKRPYRLMWREPLLQCEGICCEPEQDKEKYLALIDDTKWGLNLRGTMNNPDKFEHLQDGKCYREVEYMSFGMPLVYTYIPTYPFPFFPDEHYLLLKQPEDIFDLKDVDPVPFAEKSKETWEKYFSAKGVVELLANMMYSDDFRGQIKKNFDHLISCKLKTQYKMGSLGSWDKYRDFLDARSEGKDKGKII